MMICHQGDGAGYPPCMMTRRGRDFCDSGSLPVRLRVYVPAVSQLKHCRTQRRAPSIAMCVHTLLVCSVFPGRWFMLGGGAIAVACEVGSA